MTREFKQLGECVITEAKSYSFRFAGGGWAIFTINDHTGEFGLQSDWGTYGYRWHTTALPGGTLTRFLASKGKNQYDCDYVVSKFKLATQSEDLKNVINNKACLRNVQRLILSRRRQRSLEGGDARELWEAAITWAWDAPDRNYPSPELDDLMDGDVSAFLVYEKSGRFLVLRDELLPFFCRWLRENVLPKETENHV